MHRYVITYPLSTSSLLILLAFLSGCNAMQFDRVGAKSLSTAGQAAVHSLQQQATQVSSSLEILPNHIRKRDS